MLVLNRRLMTLAIESLPRRVRHFHPTGPAELALSTEFGQCVVADFCYWQAGLEPEQAVKAVGDHVCELGTHLYLVTPKPVGLLCGRDALAMDSAPEPLEVRLLEPSDLSFLGALQDLILARRFQMIYLDCWRAEDDIERRLMAHLRGVVSAAGGHFLALGKSRYLVFSSKFDV